MKHRDPDYGATFAPVMGGELVLIARDDAHAAPWLRMLELAGVPYKRHRDGRYSFTFAGRPDLVRGAALPAADDLSILQRLDFKNEDDRAVIRALVQRAAGQIGGQDATG